MGVPSWMVRRFPRGGRGCDDEVKLDPKKGFVDNLREVLNNVCKRQGISEDKRIAYLNSFIRLINPGNQEIGISRDDFFHCLRPLLIHESVRIRATALNLVRHFLRTRQDLASCVKLQYPYLIARSLDVKVQTDTERVQAVCVARRMLTLDAQQFPTAVARALVAVATSTIDEKDRLLRASLAALVELCLLNPDVFIACGGVTALIRNLGTVGMARMAESMLGALLFLLNKPDTRARARIDLECLAAPYTDPHTLGGGAAGGPKKGTDVGWTDTECRLQWAHVVLVSLLRSWPGLLHFCHTEKEGLRSIVATLYLNQHEVRRAVLDLFYEVLCIPQPEWSDEPQVALDAVDPSRYQDAFRIGEGFVAAEGRAVLPHCSKSRVNLQEVHLSLLLYSFLEAGLLDAIVEVIVSDDSFLSVRATILLGELLHLIHLLLPPECCHVTPVLPSLVSYAVRGRRSAANLQHFNTASAHYQRFRQQMMALNSRLLKKEEKVGNTASATATNSKRERKRTVSSQSCRSRTVSDSSGDRSRLDRDSLSAQADPAANGSYSSAEPKTTSKTASILRDIQDVLKDNTENQSSTTSLDEIGNDKQPYDDKQYLGPGHTSDLCAGDFYVAGHQPLPEFYERGGIFEEEVDDPKLTPSYPIDEPFSVRAQQRAMTAVSTLARLHRLLRKRPAPASIFLDHLITSIDKKQVPSSGDLARAKGKVLSKSKLSQLLNKECEEAIKDSGVLIVKDPFSWNWDTIRSILKGRSECFYEANHRQFLKKLVQFFMPNSRQLMRIDVGGDRRVANIYTMTALELLDCLILSPKESECEKMLYELLGSISTEISQVNTSPHNCLLSPQNVIGTLCADYFLYVGHLSRSETGRSLLEKTGVFQKLYDLISATNLDCYVKLVVSTLDYTEVGFARRIMNVALKSEVVSFRLYATKLLHVLLRTPMQDCQSMIDWVVVSLIDRVGDTDRAIRNVALEALDEACDCVEYLKSIIKMRPNHLEQHSDAGLLICVRLVSTPEGFIQMLEDGFVRRQLQYWGDDYNWRYVCVVEAKLCDSLTLHERNEDGTYCARVSGVKRTPGNVFVPPHLYGQLAQHEAGFKMLMADEHVKKCVSTVLLSSCRTDSEIHQLKAALWALGHITSSPAGARWAREQRVTAAILAAVRASAVYSVRGTALYALSMMASTEEGACALRQAGWHTTRHHRHERWPVLVALDLLEDVVVINDDEMDVSQDSSSGGGGDCSLGDPVGRGHFYLPLDLDSEDGQLMSDDAMGDHHQQQRQRRAATLPAQLGRGGASGGPSKQLVPPGGGYQHIRSYSESKADSSEMASPARMVGSQLSADSMDSRANLSIDGLRKNRPSSWDISSGSSTDSVQQYSKYNVGDRIQTLSPIPSSGSLTTIKYPAVANPQSRRTSVTNSISSHKSTRLSHQDAVGYATLRFLHRGRRPMMASGGPLPSFSPLSPIEQLAFADLRRQISPLVRPRRHYMAERNAASEFDGQGVACHSMLSDVTGATLPYQSSRSCIARGSDTNSAAESAWSGACYLGICLPHRLAELFPSDDLRHQKPPYAREITDSIQDTGLENNSSGDSETDTGTDSGGGGVPLGGGGATLGAFGGYSVANSSGSSKQRRRHDRQNCLLCTSNRVANQRVSRLRKISSSSTHRTRTETESSYGAGGEGESPIMLPWQTRGGLEGVNSVDSSSTDAASIVHRSPMDNMRSRSMVRRDILKLACQLSNPVLYKTCKQALLQLKQLYNDLFQDICVYSDVCSIIANSMHRIQARRFLQELFLDIPFTELYEDAVTLLSGGENGMDDYDQLMQGGGGGDQLICQQLQMAATTLADESNSSMSASDATAGATGGGNNFRSAKSGAKSAFNDEQRSNPLLEVIPEHDARSDSSDACCRDSLSQSMLNLSDFSAPNSFDANDGVLDAASFEQRNFNHNTTSLILGEPHSDTRPLSTSSHNTKPMIYQMHSDSLLRTSTSLPSSSSSTSRPRPTSRRRSLSKEKETEKAKQMIEQSSSKISVLQEALKQTSPSSAYQSKGFEESTNQSKGSRVIELEVVLGVSNSKQNVDPSLSNIEHHGRFCIELVDPGSSDLKVDQSSTSVEHQVALGSSLKGQVVDEGLSSLKHKTDLGLSDVNKDVDLSLSDLKDDKSSASVKHQVDQASSSLKHQSDLALSDVDQSTFKDVDPSSSDLKVDKSSTSVKHQVHQGSSSLKHHSDLGSTDGFSMEKVDDLVESALSKSCSSNVDEASNLQLSSKDVSKTDEKSSVLNQQSSKDSKNFSKFESELAVEHCNPVLESSCVPVMKNITETENVTSNLTFYNVGQQLDLKYPLLDTNEVKPKLSSCSEMENSFFKPCSSSLKVESSFPKTDRSSLKSDSTTLKSENSSLNSDSTTLKSECSYLTSDSSSKFDSTCSKSQSISSKPEASHSKTDSSTLKSDSASLKTDSNPLKQEKSPLKPESSEITSLKTESSSLKTESSSLKTDSNPSKLDKSPLKPESSAAKIEIASMKTESSSSKTDTDINPSKLDKSPLKSETKTESFLLKSDSTSLKTDSTSLKTDSTFSKTSKEISCPTSKPSNRSRRLKSQSHVGPSLLSSSPSSSSSSKSGNTASKITSKHSDDVTGPGSEQTKLTTAKLAHKQSDNTAGQGSEQTKPTTAKSQRQRKKATTKEPIRESLEVGKK